MTETVKPVRGAKGAETAKPPRRTEVAERKARTANIFDVARLAGVSHQTVSRVINDVPRVRPATRLRVEQAISQLNYSPSPAARALVTKRTRMIGLITPSSADFGPSSIALHFSAAARDARYGVVTVTSVNAEASSIRPFVESLVSQRVEAIVLVVADVAVLAAVRGLDAGVPVIAVAAGPRRGPLTTSLDQYRGARMAVRHLIEMGHRRIAHLAGPQAHPDSIERLRGWRDELAEAQLVAQEPARGDWSAESGFRFGEQLGDATAVFAANDQMALGLIAALHGRGLKVPGDVSVVGFDAAPDTAYYFPPLTTVSQDFAALGALTMERVLIAIEESDSLAESTPIPTRLIVRESTAPPRSGSK
jgi:DNA-binding LacI/PurR family transcriptional regulator